MIKAQIIKDSLNPYGTRLTTFVLEYPRFIHSEFKTHRMFSSNSSSSRAIPISKIIQNVLENPAIPEEWGKNKKGMQAKEESNDPFKCLDAWLRARDSAVEHAQKLQNLGLHKQIVNRVLEPFSHIRTLVSATDFGNFFALRAHADAQPEIRELAEEMLIQYNKSSPKKLKETEWHVPFSDNLDDNRIMELPEWEEETDGVAHSYSGETEFYLDDFRRRICVARCARVSYLNFEGKDDYSSDLRLYEMLKNQGHWSPFEHVAQSFASRAYYANFRGFIQMRKFFSNENKTDERVILKDG